MQGYVQAPGEVHNVNTLEKFKGLALAGEQNTRASYIADAATQMWQDIISGAAERDPALLWRFVVVSFAELKKYHFYYWCAYCITLTCANFGYHAGDLHHTPH